MRLPWRRQAEPETRGSVAYGDEVVRLLLQRAGATAVADVLQSLALEAAAGMVGRAFAAATVDGPLGPELEPHLEFIGRSFIRRGESILLGSLAGFERAAEWDVYGGVPWRYQITVSRPDEQRTFNLDGSRVLHFRTAEARSTPWKGRGPLQVGDSGAALISGLEAALANEANGPHGSIIPIPVSPTEAEMGDIRDNIRDLAGRTMLVESQRSGWGDGEAGASSSGDWAVRRIGANPPSGLVELFVQHRRGVLGACGVPIEILEPGQGTSRREAYRQFMHGVLTPYGAIMEREVRAKLDTDIRIRWDRLRAADVAGRARAYQSLTGAGMDAGRAEKLVGFDD